LASKINPRTKVRYRVDSGSKFCHETQGQSGNKYFEFDGDYFKKVQIYTRKNTIQSFSRGYRRLVDVVSREVSS
jgi:hypothetical protein